MVHMLRRPRRHLWERRLELLCLIASLCFMLVGLRMRDSYHFALKSFIQTGPSRDLDPLSPLRLRVYNMGQDGGGGQGEKPVAVVSTLYTDDYVEGLRVLGHSLSTHNVTARRVALYLPGQVSEVALCLARQAGWEVRGIERIAPLDGVRPHFKDQYTKLRLWELEEFSRIVYLDADTLVMGDISPLFHIPHSFAAVPDIYAAGYTSAFNAGVLVLRPDKVVFKAMMRAMHALPFPRYEAEQAFLREYYRADVMLLPYKYNMNLAQATFKPEDWRVIWPDARIVHYTIAKPFQLPRHDRPVPPLQKGQKEDVRERKVEREDTLVKAAFDRWWAASDELTAVTTHASCSPDVLADKRRRLLHV